MNLKVLILHLLLLLIFPTIVAQTDSVSPYIKWHKDKLSLTVSYINGEIAPTNIFVKGNNLNSVVIDDFQAISLKLGTQTTGIGQNEQILKYPTWGAGFRVLDFRNTNEIGIPMALNGFIDIPVFRLNRFTFNTEFAFGLSFNWKAFNPITNKFNVALGLGQAFMSEAGVGLNYELTKNLDLVVGMNFTHFSNGAIKQPNFGINAYAPKLGVKYNFYERPEFIEKVLPKFKPKAEWVFSTFAGMKNLVFDSVDIDIVEKYEGVFFPVFGLSALYNLQISHFSKIGVGATFNYNGAIDAQVVIENNELEDVDGPFFDKLQLSIYPSYELCLDRISIMIQPAFYIYQKKVSNIMPVFHQRISINYQINKNLYTGITLRDHAMHADFIEWTLGYRMTAKLIR